MSCLYFSTRLTITKETLTHTSATWRSSTATCRLATKATKPMEDYNFTTPKAHTHLSFMHRGTTPMRPHPQALRARSYDLHGTGLRLARAQGGPCLHTCMCSSRRLTPLTNSHDSRTHMNTSQHMHTCSYVVNISVNNFPLILTSSLPELLQLLSSSSPPSDFTASRHDSHLCTSHLCMKSCCCSRCCRGHNRHYGTHAQCEPFGMHHLRTHPSILIFNMCRNRTAPHAAAARHRRTIYKNTRHSIFGGRRTPRQ